MTSRPSDHLAGLAFANLTRLGATIRGPDYPVTSPNRRRSSQSVRASSSPNATFALFERRCRGSDRAKSFLEAAVGEWVEFRLAQTEK